MTDQLRTPMTLDDVRARRDEILALAEHYGAYNVRVFGSVARGEANTDSDVDLLVTARKGVDIFKIIGLWLDLQELFDCDVSLITDGLQDQQFLHRIQADLVPL